ncbi:PREDICTED: caveolin-3-like [Ceratosolen solmsi marchali]|uniref:Caveolin n=1 Tax=Ceratosolen solmsi marchali TaxID=326594 RepID=A0AAJ6YNU2_9HYME|nr:PREDICTED: caveolin-3-like [Ceratosolen solmsi marchali]
MEKPTSSMEDDSNIDLEDRDPNRLNRHIQVFWEEVIGEPEGVRSPECAWRLSRHCFRLSKGCCYVLLTVLIAPLLALCLGLTFACLAFEHVWCIVPCLRVWRITCSSFRNFWTVLVQSVVLPFTEALGYFFHNVRVFSQKPPDAQERKDDIHIV